jgi:tetratricopeptide (TPR) repeat protein
MSSRTKTRKQLWEYRARVRANQADVEAWFWIGYCHFDGMVGIEADFEEARRIWRRALRALRSRRRALQDFRNKDHVQDGTGKIRYCLERYDQAVPRLQWEAAQGDFESEWYLALCFWYGWGGLEVDHVQAAYLFQRPAEQGNPGAQLYIGVCYHDGDGMERDYVKAVEWYDKAIAQGGDLARSNRQRIVDELNETERDRVLGCVQRNKWLENVQQSLELVSPLSVWVLALEKLVGTQNKWATLSPIFLCLEELLPLLPETEKQTRKRAPTSGVWVRVPREPEGRYCPSDPGLCERPQANRKRSAG